MLFSYFVTVFASGRILHPNLHYLQQKSGYPVRRGENYVAEFPSMKRVMGIVNAILLGVNFIDFSLCKLVFEIS